MTLAKEIVVDQITITEDGTVAYREVTRITEDGSEISKSYRRTSLFPGQDLTGQPQQVVDVANLTWTAEKIAAFQEKMANPKAPTI